MMNMMIDLRSDTVTRPTPAMIECILNAKVGDDVLGDDPGVQELESFMATMFAKEAAIFCPSGTMTNQIAVKVHTIPGEEVIWESTSHVYRFEGGGMAFNSGCSVRLIQGDLGRINPSQIVENINPPDNIHYPTTRLVVAENTSNMGGGSIYDFDDLKQISGICKERGLFFHLDGARLFNALVETGERPEDYGNIFDSISICFSKGLGAPIGSILIGNKAFINKARRIRKLFGGGMRQAGYLAAASLYAVKNNVSRLKEDHRKAKILAYEIANSGFVKNVMPVQTNIVIVNLNEKYPQARLMDLFNEKGIMVVGFGQDKIRMVTHMDFTDEMLERTLEIFKSL